MEWSKHIVKEKHCLSIFQIFSEKCSNIFQISIYHPNFVQIMYKQAGAELGQAQVKLDDRVVIIVKVS